MVPASHTARRSRTSRGAAAPGSTRAITAALHFLVALLALCSLCTTRFDLWIDLRMVDVGGLGTFLKVLWGLTALGVPLCAGPRLVGVVKPRWIHQGFAPNWAEALLWPTYGIIACLFANTVYWFILVFRGVYQLPVPITLLAALLLSAWALMTREWLRVASRLPRVAPATRRTQLFAALLMIPATAFAVVFFLLLTYAHPPSAPVDLAVVLGCRVMPDGTASVPLEERTVAAIDLYERGLAKHLLLSGAVWDGTKPGDQQLNEAAAMRAVCMRHGLPESAFSLDPVGINTRATAYNARVFMQAHGYSTVAACSSDFHLYRTALSFREAGLQAFTVPSRRTVWICADPYEVLRDMAGIVVYTLDPHYRSPKVVEMKLAHPRVVVHKSANTLELFDGSALYKTYACITGGTVGDKETEGDRRTPVGRFHIVYKNPLSKFHLSMGLDYPNAEDAARGLAAGLITQPQYADILSALGSDLSLQENQQKLWYTALGGEIFLHGHAEGRKGTAGCIALANPDIEELYAILPVGTEVEIVP